MIIAVYCQRWNHDKVWNIQYHKCRALDEGLPPFDKLNTIPDSLLYIAVCR